MLFNVNQQAEILEYHSGIDVSTTDGILKWKKFVLSRTRGTENFSTTRLPLKAVEIKVSIKNLYASICS